ncbi:MAG: hypothetical protein PVI43_03540 [Candidatus Bathyarchaeota archaeon]
MSLQASHVSAISKPSVPEFTVELVAYPYDVPPVTTTSIDQYTGEKTVKTTPGYRVENRSIEIVIKNQPFTPFISLVDTPYAVDVEKEIYLYYNVRVKGHFGETWKDCLTEISPSKSEYTVLKVSADYPDGAQVDFQVEAMLAFYYDTMVGRLLPPIKDLRSTGSSGWSRTQTVTIDWNDALVYGEPETTDDAEPPDTPTTSGDKLTSENTSASNEQETLDLTWVPKDDESVKLEEVAALVGIVAVFVSIAVGVVYFKVRKH